MATLSLAFCYILTILKTFMDDRYQTGPVDFQWLKLPMPVGFEVLQIEPIKASVFCLITSKRFFRLNVEYTDVKHANQTVLVFEKT